MKGSILMIKGMVKVFIQVKIRPLKKVYGKMENFWAKNRTRIRLLVEF